MFGIGFGELIVILIIALVIFGPAKLPGVGAAVGKAIREFKKSVSTDDVSEKTIIKEEEEKGLSQ